MSVCTHVCTCTHACGGRITVNMWKWEECRYEFSFRAGLKGLNSDCQAGSRTQHFLMELPCPSSTQGQGLRVLSSSEVAPSALSFILFTQQPPLASSPWPSRESHRHPSPLRPHQPSLSPSRDGMRESIAVNGPPAPHMSIMASACLRTNKIINKKNSFKKKLSSLEISLSVSLKKSVFSLSNFY